MTTITPNEIEFIVSHSKTALANLIAVYAFGSRVQGTAHAESDLDVAVLAAGSVAPAQLWQLSQQLADDLHCEVDVLDLRASSTVMQYQVITTGRLLWGDRLASGLFECFVLSEKTALDTARAALLADIYKTGKIYG